MKKYTILFLIVSMVLASCAGAGWTKKSAYIKAYNLPEGFLPEISYDGDSLYTIHDWYGVEGYDLVFKLSSIEDSTVIVPTNADSVGNGYFYVKTGLADLPEAGVSTLLFEPNHTILSGFYGDEAKGTVWAYCYLYDTEGKWNGGHLYTLMWGHTPEAPLWTAKGTCNRVGNVPPIEATIEAYSNDRYIIRNWYGVDNYDLEIRAPKGEGVEMLDYYWEENGEVAVQCRASDVANATVPQKSPESGLEGDANGGRLHFPMTANGWDDGPIEDPEHPEFVFEW